jgi:hypothetical protein
MNMLNIERHPTQIFNNKRKCLIKATNLRIKFWQEDASGLMIQDGLLTLKLTHPNRVQMAL